MSTSTLSSPPLILKPRRVTRALQPRPARDQPISLSSVGLLVLWLLCAGVSVFGFWPRQEIARPLPAEPAPVQAVPLQVRLSASNAPDATPFAQAPARPAEAAAVSPLPPLIPVAEPSPAIAFALPVEGPTRVVAPAQAAHAASNNSADAASTSTGVFSSPPQTLVFGEGEGRQPAPSYPPRAARLGQEGVVTVRLTVDSAGNVLTAEAVQPSRWHLLNEAATRTVLQRWHFSPGEVRVFDVEIHFLLKH